MDSPPSTIIYHHIRFVDLVDRFSVMSWGGYTIAMRQHPLTPQVVQYAYSRCSFNDNFCRKTGREVAKAHLDNPNHKYRITADFPELRENELVSSVKVRSSLINTIRSRVLAREEIHYAEVI